MPGRIVILTENREQAVAAIKAVGGRPRDRGGYFKHGEAAVLWLAGHTLEFLSPAAIDLQAWGGPRDRAAFPILPDPIPRAFSRDVHLRARIASLKTALKTAEEVVIATDADREGALIGLEPLDVLGFAGRRSRIVYDSVDPRAIAAALKDKQPIARTEAQARAAYARAVIDWWFGMGPSRACTLLFNRDGQAAPVSVGRVQTPTLAMIVEREEARAAFRPQSYYEVVATVDGTELVLRYSPRGDGEDGGQGRILDRAQAEAIGAAVEGMTARVALASLPGKPRRHLFTLESLQKMAAARWGWRADKTKTVAEALRLAGSITYVRTDCAYLPESMTETAPALLEALSRLTPFCKQAGLEVCLARPGLRRGRIYDDAAVARAGHHGIIPNPHRLETCSGFALDRMSADARRLFEAVARRYIAVHLPDHVYSATTITLDVPAAGAKRRFRATGRQSLESGWRMVEEPVRTGENGTTASRLPPLRDGQAVRLHHARVEAKTTRPPKAFTTASLLEAMARNGLATAATRDEIVAVLGERGYIDEGRAGIVPTAHGCALIGLLRPIAPEFTSPALTAAMERHLEDIAAAPDRRAAEARMRPLLDWAKAEVCRFTSAILEAMPERRFCAGAEASYSKRRATLPSIGKRRIGAGQPADVRASPPAGKKPTQAMLRYANWLARQAGIALPAKVRSDYQACRHFLKSHRRAGR